MIPLLFALTCIQPAQLSDPAMVRWTWSGMTNLKVLDVPKSGTHIEYGQLCNYGVEITEDGAALLVWKPDGPIVVRPLLPQVSGTLYIRWMPKPRFFAGVAPTPGINLMPFLEYGRVTIDPLLNTWRATDFRDLAVEGSGWSMTRADEEGIDERYGAAVSVEMRAGKFLSGN